MDWKTNATLEPYPANSKTQKPPRKAPFSIRNNQAENQENVAPAQNIASYSKQTYSDGTLDKTIVKKVYVVPPEFIKKNEKADFIPPQKKPQINAANYIPEEDIVSYKLEDVNRGEIKPREFLVSNAIITASAHLSEKDEFYQPLQEQGHFEGIYTFILLQKRTKIEMKVQL